MGNHDNAAERLFHLPFHPCEYLFARRVMRKRRKVFRMIWGATPKRTIFIFQITTRQGRVSIFLNIGSGLPIFIEYIDNADIIHIFNGSDV